MLPDVSDALTEWLQPVVLKTVTQTTVDFVPTDTVITELIQCVVQVADKESLNIDSINWSKQYKWFHCPNRELQMGQFIEYRGKDFKLVQQGDDYLDYGYSAFAGEETKKALLVVS